jgi:putative phage-type endonuclease
LAIAEYIANKGETMLTEKQLEIRKKFIGGSEIATIAGLSPYASPIDVYQSKIGIAEQKTGFNLDRGNFLEPALIRWYEHKENATVESCDSLIHPDYDYIAATPDGIATKETGKRILEIKSPGPHTAQHWDDGVPDYYLPQLTFEMAVTGLKSADMAALIGGDLKIFPIDYDPRLFEALQKIADDFWHNHVLKEIPPQPDNTNSYSEYLAKRFNRNNGDFITPDGATVDTIYEYKRLKEEIKAKEQELKLLENKLKDVIQENDGLIGDFGKVTWKQRSRKYLNTKAIIQDYQIDESKYQSTKEYRHFQAYWKKGV